MKVEDLMIGDWVHLISTIHNVSFPDDGVIQDEGYTTTRTPIKITTVSENCVSYYSNKLELYITLSSKDIEPIPLTPEILKKNGFVNSYIDLSLNKDSVYKYNHFYTGNSVIVDMESNKLIVKFENDIWMNLPYSRTIYVHELQHVLKHCDIKKEIII